ncbi:hypothetical protein K1I43_15340 [Anoxybacillus sp. ST70]|uniref:hypothetical protein n=1 Tax=Anoxybacillus sp. ST70 TaxID=2864180 RepID=UPI001C6F95E9|nr:hypothetical protein [Anoxybacillus sp. ST70]MBW9219819.1 hypothetical protein [Anoxybacillus sp. ST70]
MTIKPLNKKPNIMDYAKEKYFESDPKKLLQQKNDVVNLLKELNLSYRLENNELEIRGHQCIIYGEFFPSGHLFLYKLSEKSGKYVHAHTCAGMKAITSYIRNHAL